MFEIPPHTRALLKRQCIAEMIGTYMLVLLGTGSVACAVLNESLNGLWQVLIFLEKDLKIQKQ